MKSGLSLPDRQPSAGGEEHSGKSQEEQAPGARLKAASQGPCVLSELWSPPLDHADPGLKGWFYKDREAPRQGMPVSPSEGKAEQVGSGTPTLSARAALLLSLLGVGPVFGGGGLGLLDPSSL